MDKKINTERRGKYDADRVTVINDICATAKGYEILAVRKLRKNGGM